MDAFPYIAFVAIVAVFAFAAGRDSRRVRLEQLEGVAQAAHSARRAALGGGGWEREALELDAALKGADFDVAIGEWRYSGAQTWAPSADLKKAGTSRS